MPRMRIIITGDTPSARMRALCELNAVERKTETCAAAIVRLLRADPEAAEAFKLFVAMKMQGVM